MQSLKHQIILGTTGRLLFATPVAVASAVIAEEMGSVGQLADQLVVWTTLLSSLVIFISIVLLRGIGLL